MRQFIQFLLVLKSNCMISKECLLLSSDIEVIHMSIVLNRLSFYILVVQFFLLFKVWRQSMHKSIVTLRLFIEHTLYILQGWFTK